MSPSPRSCAKLSTLRIKTANVFIPALRPARYKTIYGGRGCLHGDSLIDTPEGQVKIRDWTGGALLAHDGQGIVQAWAGRALRFEPEPLYKITVGDRFFIGTAKHRVLTPSGWLCVADLPETDGPQLAILPNAPWPTQKAFACLPRSTSDICPVTCLEDARRCLHTVLNFLVYCSLCRHPGDARLPTAADTYLALLQALADEPQHTGHVSTHADAQELERIDSLSRSLRHLSTQDVAHAAAAQNYADTESYICDRFFEWLSALCQDIALSHASNTLHEQAPALAELILAFCSLSDQAESLQTVFGIVHACLHDDPCREIASCNHDLHYSAITQIEIHGVEEYFDIFVPVYGNYYANGILHHNSGKSHFFGGLMIEDSLAEPGNSAGQGLYSVCIREVQKDLSQSSKRLLETKLYDMRLGEAQGFKVFDECIKTPGDGLIIFKGMNQYNSDSIKSLEGFKRSWWEEAHTASKTSLELLRPTLRADDSQLWFSYNPQNKFDEVDKLFRGGNPPTDSIVIEANWRDNPWFTKALEQERQDCLRDNPDQYDHIWEGGYRTYVEGAYYAAALALARQQRRIIRLPEDNFMTIHLFIDIGGTGAKSDNFVIIAAQFIDREIRVLNHYEAQGQSIGHHLDWLRQQHYFPTRSKVWLPHDGATGDKVFAVSYESAFKRVGFDVQVIPNQGRGAAKMRIETARRHFPAIYFHEPTTKDGLLAALGAYHEKKDEKRGIGLGPEHDSASHSADAFGLMCVVYDKYLVNQRKPVTPPLPAFTPSVSAWGY